VMREREPPQHKTHNFVCALVGLCAAASAAHHQRHGCSFDARREKIHEDKKDDRDEREIRKQGKVRWWWWCVCCFQALKGEDIIRGLRPQKAPHLVAHR
jgi:hypothetical protein